MSVLVRRGALLGVAATALVAVMAGLARLGVAVPVGAAQAGEHGPLFVLGVFTSVIALERAVALGRALGYLAPALGIAGAAAQIAGLRGAGGILGAGAVAALAGVNIAIVWRQSVDFTWLMLLGSVVHGAGALAWALGRPTHTVAPAWLAFFVLTIVAERLELSRLAPTPQWARRAIMVLGVLLAIAALAALAFEDGPARLLGVVLVAVAGWQLRFDLARRTVHRAGLPRFVAVGVLLGATWLAIAGAAMAALALPAVGPVRDAVLHAVLVGFVLSMVFAHAPIILPAVARIEIPFHAALYLPLTVLHTSLIARVAGDLLGLATMRTAGGVGNALALLTLFGVVLYARRRAAADRNIEARGR